MKPPLFEKLVGGSTLVPPAERRGLHYKQPSEVFCRKDVLRNFAKFTGKHLCQSLIVSKVAGLEPATSLKRDSGKCVFL